MVASIWRIELGTQPNLVGCSFGERLATKLWRGFKTCLKIVVSRIHRAPITNVLPAMRGAENKPDCSRLFPEVEVQVRTALCKLQCLITYRIFVGALMVFTLFVHETAWAVFSVNQRVQAVGTHNSRSLITPGTNAIFSSSSCSISSGALGTVQQGPQSGYISGNPAQTFVWYRISWDGGTCSTFGWSADNGNIAAASFSAPSLQSPANGAVISGTSVTLSWNTVVGAGAYSVGLRDTTNGALQSVALQVGGSYVATVVPGHAYTWDVASCASSSGGDNNTNCPNRTGNRAFTVESAVPSSFYLSFPLAGLNHQNAPINSVFDHSMTTPYTKDNAVVAFTGERGDLIYGSDGSTSPGYKQAGGAVFNVNGNYTAAGQPIFLNYDGHPGIDFRATENPVTQILATAGGVLRYPSSIPGLSNARAFHTIEIDHENGYKTYYLHSSTHPDAGNAIVEAGTSVSRGQHVANVGSKGTVGSHLHVEVHYNGVPVDPYGWAGSGNDPYFQPSANLWNQPTSVGSFSYAIQDGISDGLAILYSGSNCTAAPLGNNPGAGGTFSNLSAGPYCLEAYSSVTFEGKREYWGRNNAIAVPPNQTYFVPRNMPRATGMPLVSLANGSALPSQLPSGTALRFRVPVTSSAGGTTCQSVRVRGYFASQTSAPGGWSVGSITHDSNYVTVCGGQTVNADLYPMLSGNGKYYWTFEVDTNIGVANDPVKTDSWPWSSARSVTFVPSKPIFIGVLGGGVAENCQFAPNPYEFDPRASYSDWNPTGAADANSLSTLAQSDWGGLPTIGAHLAALIPGSVTRIFGPGRASDVAAFVQSQYQPGDLVFLAGHSDGGGDVQDVAGTLKLADVPVRLVAPIDSVELCGIIDGFIPSNVTRAMGFYQLQSPSISQGEDNFVALNSSATEVTNKLIVSPVGPANDTNAAHRNMDNDERVWRDILNYILNAVPLQRFPLQISPGPVNGSVVGLTSNITCGSTCSVSLAAGTSVTLTAVPNGGYVFGAWSGFAGCGNVNPCTFVMPASAVNLTANFTAAPPSMYLLSVQPSANGAVNSTLGSIVCGTTCSVTLMAGTSVTLTAVPNSSYAFSGWAGFAGCGNTNPCSFIMPASAVNLTANFAAIPPSTHLLSVQPSASGTVNSALGSIVCGSTCSVGLVAGTSVTLTATPNGGYVFSGWSGYTGCTNQNPCIFNMPASAVSLVAGFAMVVPTNYNLSVTLVGTGSGMVLSVPSPATTTGINCSSGTCSAAYTNNATVTLLAMPQSGSTFSGWSGGGCSGVGSCSVMMNVATNVLANFMAIAPTTYTLAAQSRKTHGIAGTFGLSIDTSKQISDAVTVEPRITGGSHSIVFKFNQTVTSIGPITVVDGAGASVTYLPSFANDEVTVNLSNVANRSRVRVSVAGVNGTATATAALGFLAGDLNNSRSVNSSDISSVKARSGQTVDMTNFIFDLNVSGGINSSDISAVKARSGLSLP